MIAQILFLAGLSVVLLAVIAFGIAMVQVALRADGGAYPTHGLLSRMLRIPSERSEANRWAFYVHRMAGVLIFGFLVLHIGDVSLYAFAPQAYTSMHWLYGTAVLRVFECGLLLAVLFHTLNGLRLIAIDLGDFGIVGARRLLAVAAGSTLVLGLFGSAFILGPLFS